jgi:peptide deformylase
MRLKIVSVGEAGLRTEAHALTADEIRSRQIRELIEYMRETLHDAPGVGLAAPQVGMPMQLAVIEDKAEYHVALSDAELAERERRPVPFHVLVNPRLQLLSPPEIFFFEGCLSVPGLMAVVPRARKVRVHALDHTGEPVHIEASGWYARILQHEIDHLRGTLYVDRMRSQSFSSLENYNRYWKSKSHDDLEREFGTRDESRPTTAS